MTTAQAKKMAAFHGHPFTFEDGYWTLNAVIHDGAETLPLFFTAAALATITRAGFHRYCYLANLEAPPVENVAEVAKDW